MAFIVERPAPGRLIQHLLYKAIIERSADRSDFLSRLFSRPRPAGLEESAPPKVLLDASRGGGGRRAAVSEEPARGGAAAGRGARVPR